MTRHAAWPTLAAVLSAGVVLVAAGPAAAGELVVDPGGDDFGGGSAGRPLKTLARALELARPGDTILLATGEYPAVSIRKVYDRPLTIAAARGARPVLTGGVSVNRGGGVRLIGLTFTWTEATRPAARPMTPFLQIEGSTDVEVADFELYDDPKLNQWVGMAASIGSSERITIRDGNAHHFYFGFSAYRCKDVILRNLDIRMWSHEDGVRVTECEGPVLIEGCHITNSGVAGAKGGHVDGIQSVFWSHNVTIRNCSIHGLGQGIGAFGDNRENRRRNWRVEGCLIYDTYAPHACSIYGCDGVTIVNNTFPQNRPLTPGSTGVVIRNNIIGLAMNAEKDAVMDYNLMAAGRKIGEHDLAGDPRFVNAPLLVLKSDAGAAAGNAITFRALPGGLAVGDAIEIMPMDGSARDATPRKVTAVRDRTIEFDPPLVRGPGREPVYVYKWPAGARSLVPDYRLADGSPAIDSADSSVNRGRDMDGREATDAPGVPNTGGGDVKYLDRGAFERAVTGQEGRTP